MVKVESIRNFIREISAGIYLPASCFDIPDEILEKATDIFKTDWQRWYPDSYNIEKLYLTPQLIAILCYRIARELHLQNTAGQCVVNQGGADAYSILGRQIGLIEIYYSAEIGEGFKINHGVGTVIGARCKIGKNCTIHQCCTIGDRHGGRPSIGDNVIIYAGSSILGGISIGNNSIIGANSLVTKTYPENSVLVGQPARNILSGSKL